MEGREKKGADGSGSHPPIGERGTSWANIVGGQSRQQQWTVNRVSEKEVDQLRRFFTKVLEFSEEEMEEARGQWDRVALLARSLGRRVPVEWVAKDFKNRGKLPNEVKSFSLAEDHLLFRFKTEEERDSVLRGGPWVIAGQLLAVEPWVPDFVPGANSINMTTAWVRLPGLPIEFWTAHRLLSIVKEAGNPIAIDDYTGQLKKMGFARVRVEFDSSLPLKPGVLIKGKREVF